MMREPEELLRTLPKEKPPPEVVLAAMRVFRYRAIAVIALACALIASALILRTKLDEDARLLERIGRIRYTTGAATTLGERRMVDGIELTLWEVVTDADNSAYVHLLARDEQGRDFTMRISNPRVDGETTSLASGGGSGGGPLGELTHVDLWQEIRLLGSDARALTFDVRIEIEGRPVLDPVSFDVGI